MENRQPIGSDKNLPGRGVLILYCDDTVEECRKGKAPVKLMVAKPDVEELNGAAFDIGPGTAGHVSATMKTTLRFKLVEKDRAELQGDRPMGKLTGTLFNNAYFRDFDYDTVLSG